MDKVFEQILKSVPPEIVPAILALAAAFFGTYYYKGMRSYTDTLHDQLFLTLAVLVIGGFFVWQIQKPSPIQLPANARPLLLVPRFENDVSRELETLFVTQLRASLERYARDAPITQINTFLSDERTARLNASDLKPFAVLFEPKVVREGVKTPVICFRLLFLDSGRITTFSAVPVEPEKMKLGDLSSALLTVVPQDAQSPNDPILSRLDALERKVAELSNTILKTTAPDRPTVKDARQATAAKRAVVVGVNFDKQHRLPQLQFAASDAQTMASVLQRYGFDVTLLVNETATRAQILDAINKVIKKSNEDDLVLLFYAGASFRSADVGARKAERLILPTYDLQLSDPLENLNLNDIVDKLRPASMLNRLIMIDGCHGTYGLPGGSGDPREHGFQIMAASQDDQFASESPGMGGGIFTQEIIAQLGALVDVRTGISSRELITAITPELTRLSDGRQLPKLVTVTGSQDIVLTAATLDGAKPAAR